MIYLTKLSALTQLTLKKTKREENYIFITVNNVLFRQFNLLNL